MLAGQSATVQSFGRFVTIPKQCGEKGCRDRKIVFLLCVEKMGRTRFEIFVNTTEFRRQMLLHKTRREQRNRQHNTSATRRQHIDIPSSSPLLIFKPVQLHIQMPFLCCCRPTTLPSELLSSESNGIVLWSEEGISGSLILRNFKSPRKRSTYYYSAISAAMAITSTKWLCYTGPNRPMINVEWSDERIRQMKIFLENKSKNNTKSDAGGEGQEQEQQLLLIVQWDANLFQESWSGQMELCLRVEDAVNCLSSIQNQIDKKNATTATT